MVTDHFAVLVYTTFVYVQAVIPDKGYRHDITGKKPINIDVNLLKNAERKVSRY